MSKLSETTDFDMESDQAPETLHLYDPSAAGRSNRAQRKRCIMLGFLGLCGFALLALTIFNSTLMITTLGTLRNSIQVQREQWTADRLRDEAKAEAEAQSRAAALNATLTPEALRAQRIEEAERRSEATLGHVYVINLAKRTDRRDTMTNMFRLLNIPVEFLTAATPATMEYTPPSAVKAKLSPGRLACWRSHMNALQDIVRHDYPVATILEDDVSVEMQLVDRVAASMPHVPADWDMFYLGHCSTGKYFGPLVKGTEDVRILNGAWCTHGYMVSQRGARKLLRLLANPVDAIDGMIAALGLKHEIVSYAANPSLVAQIRSSDDPSDIPASGHGRLWEGLDIDTRKKLDELIKHGDPLLLG
ncbi:hypothetical protein IWQ60_005650 [Tieghemiomyces parasiticus]|uniref:Glycosyl transferase family 25 domain-containing protein n=1 Tax=Tieghemiomyces parasiticus TaxID=78921 RepID=A0A9W8A5R2_9FUNG|nr:hypothetical protein IWQ60_005650 [Tieghemiomyces parasiticus]